MFDRLIEGKESEHEMERKTDLEVMNALWKVIGTWRDMARMGQTVKFDFDSFSMAVSKRMWEGE